MNFKTELDKRFLRYQYHNKNATIVLELFRQIRIPEGGIARGYRQGHVEADDGDIP
jgi:hypothetical protein